MILMLRFRKGSFLRENVSFSLSCRLAFGACSRSVAVAFALPAQFRRRNPNISLAGFPRRRRDLENHSGAESGQVAIRVRLLISERYDFRTDQLCAALLTD